MSIRNFTTRRSLGALLMLAFAFACVSAGAGCGGSATPVAQPVEGAAEPEPAQDDIIIPDEDMENIQRLFERRQNVVSRCFSAAIEAGEIGQDSGGKLQVALTISTSGAPENVRVREMQPRSEHLRQCMVEAVQSWTFPTLPKALDYTFTYRFDTL